MVLWYVSMFVCYRNVKSQRTNVPSVFTCISIQIGYWDVGAFLYIDGWYDGTMVLTVPHCTTVVLWYVGIVVLWYCGRGRRQVSTNLPS